MGALGTWPTWPTWPLGRFVGFGLSFAGAHLRDHLESGHATATIGLAVVSYVGNHPCHIWIRVLVALVGQEPTPKNFTGHPT